MVFISNLYEGSVSDVDLVSQCGLLALLERDDSIMADPKEFDIKASSRNYRCTFEHATPSPWKPANDNVGGACMVSEIAYTAKAPTLAVKLALLSVFGDNLMAQSTNMGCHQYAALPKVDLEEIKQTLLKQFPVYWGNPIEFELNCA